MLNLNRLREDCLSILDEIEDKSPSGAIVDLLQELREELDKLAGFLPMRSEQDRLRDHERDKSKGLLVDPGTLHEPPPSMIAGVFLDGHEPSPSGLGIFRKDGSVRVVGNPGPRAWDPGEHSGQMDPLPEGDTL